MQNHKEQVEFFSGENVKTLRDLRDLLNKATDEQLDQKALYWRDDEGGGYIEGVMTLESDYINPSGEACEPLDYYKQFKEGDADYLEGIEDEDVVLKKGSLVLASGSESVPMLAINKQIQMGDFKWDNKNGITFVPNPYGKWAILQQFKKG